MQNQLDLIIEILRQVPEKKLLIFELANKIPIQHGVFAFDALQELTIDIQLATKEAKEYSHHTEHAVELITRVAGDSEVRIRTVTREEFIEGIIPELQF